MLLCCVHLPVICNICIVDKQVCLTEKLSEEANRKWPKENRMVA